MPLRRVTARGALKLVRTNKVTGGATRLWYVLGPNAACRRREWPVGGRNRTWIGGLPASERVGGGSGGSKAKLQDIRYNASGLLEVRVTGSSGTVLYYLTLKSHGAGTMSKIEYYAVAFPAHLGYRFQTVISARRSLWRGFAPKRRYEGKNVVESSSYCGGGLLERGKIRGICGTQRGRLSRSAITGLLAWEGLLGVLCKENPL